MTVAPHYIATVPTGLESVAAEELRARTDPLEMEIRRGRILLATGAPESTLRALRTVFRLFARLGTIRNLPVDATGPAAIRRQVAGLDWAPAMALWRRWHPHAPGPPAFRASVRRSGEHGYRSPEAAGAIGAGVRDRFDWPVNLDAPDLEVFGQLADSTLELGLTLTPQSLHRRRYPATGRAGLKGPIAAALVRLAAPGPGEVTLDPMCGVATIPLEALHHQPRGWHLAGELEVEALAAARQNIGAAAAPRGDLGENPNGNPGGGPDGDRIGLFRADARALPLATGSVDAVICDLPFGRRIGSHRRNLHLYPPVLAEMARVVRPGGRAVLLSLERRLMQRRLRRDGHWHCRQTHRLEHGGLSPQVYQLERRHPD